MYWDVIKQNPLKKKVFVFVYLPKNGLKKIHFLPFFGPVDGFLAKKACFLLII